MKKDGIVIRAAGYAFAALTLGGGTGYMLLMQAMQMKACLVGHPLIWCIGS